VVEVDHQERVINGWLIRDDAGGDRIPIKHGKAILPDGWKSGEMLTIESNNPDRYATPHHEPCPLPATNLIQIRTKSATAQTLANAAYLESRDPLLAAYAYYLAAGRLKPTQQTEKIAFANQKSINLLAQALGVQDPVKRVEGPNLVTTSEFQDALRQYQSSLGITATGKVDYPTLKAANNNIPASRLTSESAKSSDFKRLSKELLGEG
jgi:hypothetical protein